MSIDTSYAPSAGNAVHIRALGNPVRVPVNVPRVINPGDLLYLADGNAEPAGMQAADTTGTIGPALLAAQATFASNFLGCSETKRISEQAGPPKDLSTAQILCNTTGIYQFDTLPLASAAAVGDKFGVDGFALNSGSYTLPDGSTTTAAGMYIYPNRLAPVTDGSSAIAVCVDAAPAGQAFVKVALQTVIIPPGP